MSFHFSERSLKRLATCDERIQAVLKEAIEHSPLDFSILCGHRSEQEQNAAVEAGTSKLPWPMSKHNAVPSKAVDIAPYPLDWENTGEFRMLAGVILSTANRLGVKLRWGGDWKSFVDMPHFELED